MTNLGKYLIALALVLGAFGTLAFFGQTPFLQVNQVVQQASQQVGSVVETNTPWFSNGYKYGNTNALFTSATLNVANGSDQAVWQNNTGQNVVIDTVHLVTNATSSTAIASSTYQFNVGATSTPTIAEPDKTGWITSTNTWLSINGYNLATSSAVANKIGGISHVILADNYWFHASSTSTFIEVPSGQYFFVKIDSNCLYPQAGITCETATSTNRGFTTVTVPFWYHYSSQN